MLSQEQAEKLAHAYVEKYIAELQCATVNEAKMGIQKFIAVAAHAYDAVAGRNNVVELLSVLTQRFIQSTQPEPELEIVEKRRLNG